MSSVIMTVKDSNENSYVSKFIGTIDGANVYECYNVDNMKKIMGYVAIVHGRSSSLCNNAAIAATEINNLFKNHKNLQRPTVDIERYYASVKKGTNTNAIGIASAYTK